MSKLYIPTSKKYQIKREAFESLETLKNYHDWMDDLVIEEIEERDWLSEQLPPEFRGPLAYLAYERGHSAGQDEVDMIFRNLVTDLLPAIKAFESRIKGN